jgi:hypothetical protein
MKTLLSDPVIGTIVKVPIRAKMDDDDEDLDGFHFGSSQESKLDPPLVLESVWYCLGITLATTVDDNSKSILVWSCGYCLIPSKCGGPRFFKHCKHLRLCHTLGKGRTLSLAPACGTFLQKLSMP